MQLFVWALLAPTSPVFSLVLLVALTSWTVPLTNKLDDFTYKLNSETAKMLKIVTA